MLAPRVAAPMGAPMKGSPAIRAESISVNSIDIDFGGSTAVTMGSMVKLACVVAYCKAVYQSLKKALMSAKISKYTYFPPHKSHHRPGQLRKVPPTEYSPKHKSHLRLNTRIQTRRQRAVISAIISIHTDLAAIESAVCLSQSQKAG